MPERLLVITEKPSSARHISQALDDSGKPMTLSERTVQYHVAHRGGDELIVVSALGHLYALAQTGRGWSYPVYDMKWVPADQAQRANPRTKAHIDAISSIAQGVDRYVSACDYDIEGSLIAYNVLKYAVGEHSLGRSRRMLYSTLTVQELVKAWDSMQPTLDYPVIAAGKARHETDWLFGINLSRALTLSVRKATGSHKTLSIGRVQGPTLGFIKDREAAIQSFVPVPYWKVDASTEIDGEAYPLEYEKPRLEREVHAKELAAACRGKQGTVKALESSEERQPPPPPFNLGDLQREAYRVFKMSPSTTLKVAEKLYLGAHLSYPRTSSQKLPPTIDFKEILKGLARNPSYAKQAETILQQGTPEPRQGKKDDPAHPAIHPTGSHPRRLGDAEKKVYDLVVKRFLACLSAPAFRKKMQASVDVNGYLFYMKGSRTVERGWIDVYAPYHEDKELILPELHVGMTLPVSKLSTRRSYTNPPPRYNASSLLRQMETKEIGTKATRTNIIETLHKRGYVEGSTLKITDLGYSIAETLEEYCPEIMGVEMTRRLEEELDEVQRGGRNPEEVVESAVKTLDPVLRRFKEMEKEIGASISETLTEILRKENYLGRCPSCGDGEIHIRRNPRTGKPYASCTNERCSQSYSLPQRKKVYPTGRRCPSCGAPVIRMYYHRKPWDLCLNPECPTKKEGQR
ncbi:DNA topoisomerase I [Candidatus Bathyarchaeota archaeon]|nr:DNA topoisomerase I [Candidatus Bathyarchaeota archaeon]